MAELEARQIPIIVSGVFDGGFLVGGNRLDGRVLSAEDPADRSLLTWRTSFAALCHGHGVTPAQASIQFALSGPGVVAVVLNSSHPDRAADNIAFVERTVPDAFWASMKEEGLLAADYPYLVP
jgi:D-threo-aldose 1-dehydrogenase